MPDYSHARSQMVGSQLQARGVRDARVLAAMGRVPRHEFVPEALRSQAYEDHPLPIGEEQTISQPYVVAVMLESLELAPGDNVLEIGTGSGYVTALLAELAARVVSIERHASLAGNARNLLAALGYTNVEVVTGDGALGMPGRAPFDAILVSAAALEIPPALPAQLREAGRVMIPIGSPEYQRLHFVRKVDGQVVTSLRDAVRFVPLVSGR